MNGLPSVSDARACFKTTTTSKPLHLSMRSMEHKHEKTTHTKRAAGVMVEADELTDTGHDAL